MVLGDHALEVRARGVEVPAGMDINGRLAGIGDDRIFAVPHPLPGIGAVVSDDGDRLRDAAGVAAGCEDRQHDIASRLALLTVIRRVLATQSRAAHLEYLAELSLAGPDRHPLDADAALLPLAPRRAEIAERIEQFGSEQLARQPTHLLRADFLARTQQIGGLGRI
ncbi:MAG: hypothetical protein GJU76_15230, partial [Gallionella sp.]|nr:hypothetical protein [Gallionella sp.]